MASLPNSLEKLYMDDTPFAAGLFADVYAGHNEKCHEIVKLKEKYPNLNIDFAYDLIVRCNKNQTK